MSIIEIRQIFVWFELSNTKDLGPFTCKLWSNNNFVCVTSFFVAVVSYVVIPVLLIMVSLLLILESGSVTDVIKDTLSLLFLNDINNYLQVRNAPEARKWKILLKEGKLREMTRHKSNFTTYMFLSFGMLGIGWVLALAKGLDHPSLMFNTLRWRSSTDIWAWIWFGFSLVYVYCAVVISLVMSWFRLKRIGRISDFEHWITKEEDKEQPGLFYQYVYLPASKVQGFIAETFNPDDDMDEDWEEDRVVNSVAYSADGSRLARSEGNDVVVCDVRDAVTGVEIRLKGHR